MRHRFRLVILVSLLTPQASCSSWREAPLQPSSPNNLGNQSVRVTLRGGQRLELGDASLVGDSLIGQEQLVLSWRRRALPISDVQRVEARRVNAGRTVAFVAGAAVVSVVVIRAVIDAINGVGLFKCFPIGTAEGC